MSSSSLFVKRAACLARYDHHFSRDPQKICSAGLWWVPFFIIAVAAILKPNLSYISWHRLGHLDEAAHDLSVAEEMTEGHEAKATLCQKLVSSMLQLLLVPISFQSWTVSSPQVLTYKISDNSEEAKNWTEKLKFHLECLGINKQEKVKHHFLLFYFTIRSFSGKDSSEVELKGFCEEETTSKQRQVLISTNTRGGEKWLLWGSGKAFQGLWPFSTEQQWKFKWIRSLTSFYKQQCNLSRLFLPLGKVVTLLQPQT